VFDSKIFIFNYTIEFYNSTDPHLSKAIKTTSEISNTTIENTKNYEITLRNQLPFFSDIYTDNGFTIQKRQIYSPYTAKEFNYTTSTGIDFYGLNGFGSIHGSLFSNNETFYGYTNSHASLLHVLNRTEYEVMLK
jgi:hypothetical protein